MKKLMCFAAAAVISAAVVTGCGSLIGGYVRDVKEVPAGQAITFGTTPGALAGVAVCIDLDTDQIEWQGDAQNQAKVKALLPNGGTFWLLSCLQPTNCVDCGVSARIKAQR